MSTKSHNDKPIPQQSTERENGTDEIARVKVSKTADGKLMLGLESANLAGIDRLMAALGTSDTDFVNGLIFQVGVAGGEPDERENAFILSVVKGIRPRDQLEAMLAAQMAAVHMRCMTHTRHLNQADSYYPAESVENMFNKAMRTFAAQMEALTRYRAASKQQITAQGNYGDEAASKGEVAPSLSDDASTTAGQSATMTADAKVIPMPRRLDEVRKPLRRPRRARSSGPL
jgi:hypothetical protein